jgi:chaperonin GroES
MLKPLNEHVIVKPLSKEEKTASGIILPETVKEKPEQGEIIAVGPGKLLENGQRAPLTVKIGDKVIFTKYSPNEIKVENQEYLVLNESDILAIVE